MGGDPVTQPTVAGPDEPTAEEIAYEEAWVAALIGPVATAVAAALASASVGVAAGVGSVLLARALASRLRRISWTPLDGRIQDVATDAILRGVRTTAVRAPVRVRPEDVPVSPPDRLPDMDGPLRAKLDEAADMADGLTDMSRRDLDAVAGRARSGVARAQGSVRWTVNHGINSGTADVARHLGQRVLWVAERNACLHCLAYAGWSTEPDGEFPPGLSFDPAGGLRPYGPLLWPPLHPNCRCRIRLYDGPAGPPDPDRSKIDPAARLAGEARRSVVYQWSDYASGAAARRAATALLDSGAGLADSVEKRARAALRSGRTVRRPR